MVYPLPMSDLRALHLIRANISALLTARRQSQTELAFWMRKGKSWINKFLNGTREIQLKDLDRIADFFGIATYQLFQPGISPLTERRKGYDRRSGSDRRVGHTHRQLRGETEKAHPQRGKDSPHEAATGRKAAALHSLIVDFTARADRLLAEEDARGQAAQTRSALAKTRPRRRASGGSDAPKG